VCVCVCVCVCVFYTSPRVIDPSPRPKAQASQPTTSQPTKPIARPRVSCARVPRAPYYHFFEYYFLNMYGELDFVRHFETSSNAIVTQPFFLQWLNHFFSIVTQPFFPTVTRSFYRFRQPFLDFVARYRARPVLLH
jgi:hypothetical protein